MAVATTQQQYRRQRIAKDQVQVAQAGRCAVGPSIFEGMVKDVGCWIRNDVFGICMLWLFFFGGGILMVFIFRLIAWHILDQDQMQLAKDEQVLAQGQDKLTNLRTPGVVKEELLAEQVRDQKRIALDQELLLQSQKRWDLTEFGQGKKSHQQPFFG